MSSSSLGTILLEKGEGGQRVVKLRSIWHWKLQLQGETGQERRRGPGEKLPPKALRRHPDLLGRERDEGGSSIAFHYYCGCCCCYRRYYLPEL